MTLTLVAPLQKPPRPPRTAPAARSPQKRVYAPFTLPHFRRWASDLILDTGQSWVPEDFFEAFVEDVFAGFAECWLIVPEGNTKTTSMSGLALYHCEHRPFAVVPVAAASREQAEITYRQAEGFVLRSERLYASVHSPIQEAKGKRKTDVPRFMCLEGYRRINHHEGGRIQVFAADDRTGDGIIPTLGLIDEPHRQRDLSLYRTWAGKLLKRDGQLATISTAGEPGSDFEETRERIREQATDVRREGSFLRAAAKRVVLHEWALPADSDPQDFAAVKTANPFTGITVETLGEKFKSPTMTMNHWLRFVCNRPTREVESWLGPNAEAIWRDLEQPYSFVPSVPIYAGVDVALKHDTTAVVAVQRRTDTEPGKPARYHATCRIWTPTDDRPVDVLEVMAHVRALAATYTLEATSYDPRFFDVPAKLLEREDGLVMVEVPQEAGRMTTAIGSLYEAIMSGQITHDADDHFTKQVLNAVPKFNDRAFTLQKSRSHGKIDAAIALALAYDQALRHEGEEPSIYEERGLVAFG